MLTSLILMSAAYAADTHVTFSGRALDAQGQPVNGTMAVGVRLTTVDDQGAEVQLWSDTFNNTPVADGYFSVVLGSEDSLSSDVFRDNDPVWAEATLGTTVLDPQQLFDVPTAAMARSVTLPEPSASCTSGAMAYDTATATLQVCAAGAWTMLPTQAQTECVARGGEWTASGCVEYAVEGCDPCDNFQDFVDSCGAIPGYHACVWGDFPLALRSIMGQSQDGVLTVDSHYMWVAGYNVQDNQTTTGNQVWYPWSGASGTVSNRMQCGTDSAVMYGVFQGDSSGVGANGCYMKTYASAYGACCRNFPW